MKKNYCIYLITNIINNKVYIGKTKADPSRRWKDHIRFALKSSSKHYIHSSIRKYGVDNFKFEIVKYYATEISAYKSEQNYIKKYKSFGAGGYNQTPGGLMSGKINRKLRDSDVKKLIRDYIYRDLNSNKLCVKYRLAKPCVLDILNRRSYTDVKLSDAIRYQLWLCLHRNYYCNQVCRYESSNVIITKEHVKNIFKDFSTGNFTLNDLAKKYNTVVSNVCFILNRQTHKDVPIDKRILNRSNFVLANLKIKNKPSTSQDRKFIKNNIFLDFSNGMSKKNIAIKYAYNISRVSKILNKTCWKSVPLELNLIKWIQPKTSKITQMLAKQIITAYCQDNDFIVSDYLIKYNISDSKLFNILKRDTFRKVPLVINESDYKSKLTKDNIK